METITNSYINETKKNKAQAEDAIAKIIQKFEKESGLFVDSVSVNNNFIGTNEERSVLLSREIKLQVKLGV